MASTEKTTEHVHIEKLVPARLSGNPIYTFLLAPTQITSAQKGAFTARLLLNENHINSNGTIHGAVSATIIDWAGGMAIASYDLREKSGVSIDIHITYQSGAKLGDELEIEGVVEKVGGSIAFTRIGIYLVEDGQRGRVVASGTHTK